MPSALPAGTVTFVFTDIEGSTRLLRALHDEYSRMLTEHHSILDRLPRRGRRLSRTLESR